ncbi:MAG: cell division protein FtsQ/DivIB [Lachnospiraceae bacterium]
MEKRKDNVVEVQFKRSNIKLYIGLFVGVIVLAVIILLTCFKIDEIEVTGNSHYSNEQIKDFVLADGYIDNSVLLMLKNKFRPMKEIPFIAKMDIEYSGAHKVIVTVYEKAMAGCIEYMDQYIYFDRDGYVLEISLTKLDDTPCINGIFFDSMELHEKLPIEDEKRFKTILTLTQLIEKYDVHIDSIRFTTSGDIVLRYEDIKIELGDGSKIEEQLVDLNRMLDSLKGKKGTLDLKEFDSATGTASFRVDDGTKKQPSDGDNQEDESSETSPDGTPLEGTDEDMQGVTEENSVENTQETLDNEVQN